MGTGNASAGIAVNPLKAPPKPAERTTEHQFNNDLLMADKDGVNRSLEKVNAKYKPIAFAFDLKPLRDHFTEVDGIANELKILSSSMGVRAVLCAAASLYFAWFTPHLEHPFEWAALIAAILGALSVVIGVVGVLPWGWKETWLRQRFRTERIRQFFFQMALMRLPDLLKAAAGDDKARQTYQDLSRDLFQQLRQQRTDHPNKEVAFIVADEPRYDDDWLLGPLGPKEITADMHTKADEKGGFYDLYKWLRIEHQASYAADRLSKKKSLHLQHFLLHYFALACIIVMIGLHLWGLYAHVSERDTHWVEITVLGIALAALIVKVFEEGLQSQREVERYEDYLAHCEIARQQFDEVRKRGGPETFAAMLNFERLVYEEMKHFLRTHHRAHFLV